MLNPTGNAETQKVDTGEDDALEKKITGEKLGYGNLGFGKSRYGNTRHFPRDAAKSLTQSKDVTRKHRGFVPEYELCS